ncbi:MAG: hypothetical protein HC806_06270 [Anaerolineae bacterium]|nr:hypothetical protein [Anaerolineae bacterium]
MMVSDVACSGFIHSLGTPPIEILSLVAHWGKVGFFEPAPEKARSLAMEGAFAINIQPVSRAIFRNTNLFMIDMR